MSNEREPVISKDAQPLPYVQRGMRVVHPDDNPGIWWVVVEVLGPSPCTARLVSMDAREVSVPCPEIRERFRLWCDFDPNATFSWSGDGDG